jgi:high affinity Mn2+ porin
MRPTLIAGALAASALCCALPASAAGTLSQADLARLLEQLNQRVERLEQRNAELERELRARGAPAAIEQRVQALETQQAQIKAGLESETLSEREPELTMRLKAVETQAATAGAAAKKLDEALDGISAGLSLTTVAQKPYRAPDAGSQLNYRADAFVTLPLAKIGDIEHKVYAHARLGQGAGLSELATFSGPNATAFQLGSLRPDDSVATLAQIWYQASIPLPRGGHRPQSKETLEITFGKMDPFVFFDQNAVAGDESRQFLNSVFVHNPLLDAGGDIGVDANGFAPGLSISYANARNSPQTWRLSLGAFGTGEKGSNYQRTLASPLLIAQAETEQRLFGGLPGNYRLYAWRNPQAGHFDPNLASAELHTGWGISADQRVGDGVTLFGRYGQSLRGHVQFDRALTLGAEFNGSYWNRGGDAIGAAGGWLRTSRDYRDAVAGAGSAERVFELYYRWRVNEQFELSPNFQYIGSPAGDSGADAIKIIGLRAQITY